MEIKMNLTTIPNKNYQINYDKDKDTYYGVEVGEFELPEKVYGDYEVDIAKYLKNFESRPKNLGILLDGVKGGGKSIMAKMLCIKAEKPVLIINQPFCGDSFNTFLSEIKN